MRAGHGILLCELWSSILSDNCTERGARAFFELRKGNLTLQRLGNKRKPANMIEYHPDGIASLCPPENKISLCLVKGVHNMIRTMQQQQACSYRDEEYIKLKFVVVFLPPLPRNAVSTHRNPHEPGEYYRF